jgi:hypothetical protein
MKKGDKLYVPTQLYISRGEDDIQGGIATVNEVKVNPRLPEGHYNSIFVSFDEIPGRSWNINYLLENQDKWREKYKDEIARPDPDINTPWIQDGDIVNGERYSGPSIW